MNSAKFPAWLKKRLPASEKYNETLGILKNNRLHTVCESAACPNMGECFSKSTAAFLILGEICTRGCMFCDIKPGKPLLPDFDEPARLRKAVELLGLKYVVITSVTRDDLADGGAGQFAAVIRTLKAAAGLEVEVLIPDFNGEFQPLKTVIGAKPEVIAHNLEMVKELYPKLRSSRSSYERSLGLLRNVKKNGPGILVKTGIMVGLGEKKKQLTSVIEDIAKAGCDILTIGQYLRPSKSSAEVKEYYLPEEFLRLKQSAVNLGIKSVYSGPFVRSSYNARELYTDRRMLG